LDTVPGITTQRIDPIAGSRTAKGFDAMPGSVAVC
jgi:hypothetical protein